MNNYWKDFIFNSPYVGEPVTAVNGVTLIKSYLDFMNEHNGGEGDIGNSWLQLYPLEDLESVNYLYELNEFLPGHVLIGSNGGGEFFGIDSEGNLFIVPAAFDPEDVTILGTDMYELAEKINLYWENLSE